jgi:hypothetical protein
MRSFESNEVNSVCSYSNKDKFHGNKVERSPMVLKNHVGVSRGKDNEIYLLGFVGYA